LGNYVFEVGDVAEVTDPKSCLYRGVYKVNKKYDNFCRPEQPYVSLLDLCDPIVPYPVYIMKAEFLYKIPLEELPFKLLATPHDSF